MIYGVNKQLLHDRLHKIQLVSNEIRKVVSETDMQKMLHRKCSQIYRLILLEIYTERQHEVHLHELALMQMLIVLLLQMHKLGLLELIMY